MSDQKQLFSASLAKDAVYKTGLRSFMEYRDLGIEHATHGKFRAHVIRIKDHADGAHDMRTTGLHQHQCDFQMFYVLKGWMKFVYEGQGEHTFHAGDCVLQPAGIVEGPARSNAVPRVRESVFDFSVGPLKLRRGARTRGDGAPHRAPPPSALLPAAPASIRARSHASKTD